MLSLNLPVFDTKINVRNGKNVIFDVIRKRYVALTPEEWVRQHFVHFLIAHKGYPTALLANEVMVKLNGTTKRCDTVLYRRDLSARMIVEYKAPHIEITQTVFDQIKHIPSLSHPSTDTLIQSSSGYFPDSILSLHTPFLLIVVSFLLVEFLLQFLH